LVKKSKIKSEFWSCIFFSKSTYLTSHQTASDEPQAKYILDNFLTEINRQCDLLSDGGDFLQRLRFTEIGQHFKNVYGNHPMELVRTVKKILSIETRLVQDATATEVNGTGEGIKTAFLSDTFLIVLTGNRDNHFKQRTHKTTNINQKTLHKKKYF